MLPLALATVGEKQIIKKITGNDKTRRHLQELGLVVASIVSVVSNEGGNMILAVGNGRVALGGDLSSRIMV